MLTISPPTSRNGCKPPGYKGRGQTLPRVSVPALPCRQIPHNFYPTYALTQHVAPLSIPALLATIDCEHPDGASFVVVSKQTHSTTAGSYATTVLDVNAGRFYRAQHLTGLSSLLKGVAARRPAIKLLKASELYKPA